MNHHITEGKNVYKGEKYTEHGEQSFSKVLCACVRVSLYEALYITVTESHPIFRTVR